MNGESVLKKMLLIFFLNMTMCLQLSAVHVFGGELEAVNTGGDNYKFRLTAYVDCSRVSGMASTETFQVYDASNTLIKSITLSMILRDTLPVIQNACASAAAGTCVGRVVLEGTGTLPLITGGYTLAYGSCCRNSNTTNMISPGSTGQVYVLKLPGGELVNTPNSAPVFNSLPPSEICTNMPMSVDFSATDADGDLLKYRLATPYGDVSGGSSTTPPIPTISFAAPYTAADPLNANIQIDSLTGEITGTPKNIGLFVIGVVVEEYRNGKLIGSKIRDFTYTIVACTPAMTVSNPLVSTCANLPVQFDYVLKGPLKPGTTPKWNFGDPGSGVNNTSTLKNPTHQYPTLGTYFAAVEMRDFCGNLLRDTVRVDIVETLAHVDDPGVHCKGEQVTLTSNDPGCSQMTWYSDAVSTTSIHTGCSYTFTLADSNCVYFEPFADPATYTVGANGFQSWGTDLTNTATFDALVPLTIEGFSLNGDQYWSGCTKFNATFTIEKAGSVISGPITKTINCDGTTASVVTGLNLAVPAGTGYSLKVTGATLKPTTGASIVNKIGVINFTSAGPFYNIQMHSDQKCAVRDKFCIKSVCPCPDTSLKFPAPICSNVDFDLNSLKTATTSPGTWSIVSAPVGSNPATLNGSKFNAGKNGDGGQYTLMYTMDGGPYPLCVDSNIRIITINQKDTAKITLNQGPYCLSDGVQMLKLEGISNTGTWSGKGITNANTATFDPVAATVGSHLITYTTNGICPVQDTLTVVVVNQKISNIITPDTAVCSNAPKFKIRTSANTTPGGIWTCLSNPGVIDASGNFEAMKGNAGSTYKIYYALQGATISCSAIDSVSITLNSIDTAKITLNQGPFCIAGGSTLLQLEAISDAGLWSGTGITNAATGAFDPNAAGAGLKVISYTTSGICPVVDTVQITVVAKKIANILSSDTTVCQNTAAFNIRLSANSSSGGIWMNGLTPASNNFNPTAVGTTKYYYAVQGLGAACSAIDSVNITVKANANASLITPAVSNFCLGDPGVTIIPTITPATGIWWSNPAGAVNSSGFYDPALASVGATKVHYGISGMCGDTNFVTLTLHPTKNPTITKFGPLCESAKNVVMKSVDPGTWTIDGNNSNGNFLAANYSIGMHEVILKINDFCPVADTITVEVKKTPSTIFTADTLGGCIPLNVKFTDASDSLALSSKWYIVQNGKAVDSMSTALSSMYNFKNPGCYDIILSNKYAYGCSSSYQYPSQVCTEGWPIADFEFLDLPKNIQDPTVNIENRSLYADSYYWSMPEGDADTSTLINPYTRYNTLQQDTFPVTLIASNQWCSDSITKHLVIHDVFGVYVPNAFSPNGDGKNETFYPTGRNLSGEHYNFMVFNRWGELIYQSNTPLAAWNGKKHNTMEECQIDVYVWKLLILNTSTNKKEELSGTVTLVR